MNWLEIGNVQFLDYSYHDWTKGVKLGYLISFSEKDGILIRDSQSFELIFNNVSYGGKKLYYYIFEEELFFTVNDRIFKFDFGIKAFGKSIGRAVHEEVQDSVMVFCQGRNYSLKAFESGPVGPVIPFCQRQSVGILVSIP